MEKELALLKTKASPAVKAFVTKNAHKFHVRIDDASEGCYIIEQTGTTAELDEFEVLIKKFGILEMVRTGKILITRGRKRLNLKQPLGQFSTNANYYLSLRSLRLQGRILGSSFGGRITSAMSMNSSLCSTEDILQRSMSTP